MASASYLHYRYGWQYGFPAYIASVGFAYDRVRNKAHSWGDMLGTAAIVNIVTYFLVNKFTDDVKYLPDFGVDKEKKKGRKTRLKMTFIPSIVAEKKAYLLSFKMKF